MKTPYPIKLPLDWWLFGVRSRSCVEFQGEIDGKVNPPDFTPLTPSQISRQNQGSPRLFEVLGATTSRARHTQEREHSHARGARAGRDGGRQASRREAAERHLRRRAARVGGEGLRGRREPGWRVLRLLHP